MTYFGSSEAWNSFHIDLIAQLNDLKIFKKPSTTILYVLKPWQEMNGSIVPDVLKE